MRPAASRVIHAPAEIVLKAVRQALAEYNYDVTGVQRLGPQAWSLDIRKTNLNNFPDELDKVLIEAQGPRETSVQLMGPAGFFRRFSSGPEWADAFFIRVFDLLP